MTGATPPKYDWFSPQDFEDVALILSKQEERERFIIVGGQSLVGWCQVLEVPVPAPKNTPYLTQDLDLLCTRNDAAWLAGQLGTELHQPTIDDATPQTGKLLYRPSLTRGLLVIDCLSGILGPSTEHVQKMAVTVDYNGVRLNLLHPLQCLQSRVANLYHLKSKRDGNGVAQALVAVHVVRAYLEQQAASPHVPRVVMMRAVRRLLGIARSSAGIFCFENYGVNPLHAITAAAFDGHTRLLGKHRYQQPLRLALRKQEIAIARRNGSTWLSRKSRGADELVNKQARDLLAIWGYHKPAGP